MRIVLCDDHRLFVEPLGAALGRRGHDVVVVTRSRALCPAVDRHRPHLCVVDLKFPEGSGLHLLPELRRRHPDCKVVVLSGSATVSDAATAAALGAAGFLHKDRPISTIFDALDRIAAGATVAPHMPRRAESGEREHVHRLIEQLTKREREVLQRLISAEDTLDIARAMGVAPSTARTHLQNVLFKLGVHNRLQAVALVAGAGIADEL